jgi:hypothetical protein
MFFERVGNKHTGNGKETEDRQRIHKFLENGTQAARIEFRCGPKFCIRAFGVRELSIGESIGELKRANRTSV